MALSNKKNSEQLAETSLKQSQLIDLIAKRFAELGHPTRLTIFVNLVKYGENGLPVGDLQQLLAIPGSTLSHHISKLVAVGLIEQERDGRTLFCKPQFSALNEVVDFIMAECCIKSCDTNSDD